MKDGCLSKLTITESGHQATQYKKVIDTLPVFCADRTIDMSTMSFVQLPNSSK